jgi:hypothetical protein
MVAAGACRCQLQSVLAWGLYRGSSPDMMFWGVRTEGCPGPVEGWRSALDCCVVKKVEGCAGVCLTITCLYVYSNTELSHL